MPDNKNDDVLNDLLSGKDDDVRWIAEDLETIVYRSEEERFQGANSSGPDVDELQELRDSSEKIVKRSHEVGEVRQPGLAMDVIQGLSVFHNELEFNVIDVGPRGLTIRFGNEASFGVGQPLKGMQLKFKGRLMPVDAEVLFVAKDADNHQLCGLRLMHSDKAKEDRLLELLTRYKEHVRQATDD